MKSLILSLLALCALGLFHLVKSQDVTIDLPTLHQIKEVTLSPAYSCRPPDEFARGYENTALFLSDFTKRRNGPDLLFNGACGAEDYFQVATAGDDMSLIADLGTGVSLEQLSASRSFNVERVHSFPAYSKFAKVVKVEAGHAYAVLLNASDKRGLFVFSVTEYVRNKKVSLRYAVKSYQVMNRGHVSSVGFEWDKGNAVTTPETPRKENIAVLTKYNGPVTTQRVTLRPPHDRARTRYDETVAALSFKTGRHKLPNSTDWDLGYGFLNISDEDWFQVGTIPRDKRSVMKELGKYDWTDSFDVPVLEPLPELKEGQNRTIGVDSSADTHKGWARDTSDFAKAKVGYMYLVHVKDAQADFYVLFRVEEMAQREHCTISWARVPEPAK